MSSRLTPERLTGISLGLAGAGFLLTGWLVLSELFREATCPELFGVPACFLVSAGYLAAIVGTWLNDTKKGQVLLYIGAGAVTLIGVYFSLGEVRGVTECPSFEGLPMCYLSLATGATILALELLRRRRVA